MNTALATDIAAIGIDLLAEVGRLILGAIDAKDSATLRRVADVLPADHGLRSRAALVEARAAAERALAGGH